MPELLLELFSEEIPARMQRRAADELRKVVTNALVEAGLVYEGAKAFVTPRRLALTVTGIPARSPDTREEKKGPRVGAPQQAIAGRKATTAQMRDRFNAVEAVFASLDGLVEQFSDKTFVAGYHAARTVRDLGHGPAAATTPPAPPP